MYYDLATALIDVALLNPCSVIICAIVFLIAIPLFFKD